MDVILHSSQTIVLNSISEQLILLVLLIYQKELKMVMPGDNVEFTVELIHPIAVENGTQFSIREGGHTVGAGVVSEIIE